MGATKKHKEKERAVKSEHATRSRHDRSRSKSRDKDVSHSKISTSFHRHSASQRHREREATRKRHHSSEEDREAPRDKSRKVNEETHHVPSNKKLEESTHFTDDRTGEPDSVSSGQKVDSLSIDETNALRAKLGLKPLQVDDGSDSKDGDDKKDEKKEVFVKTENISEKKEAEKIRERIQQQREKRKIQEKLKRIKGLAQSDSDEEDAAAWVTKSKKLQEEKQKAAQRARLLDQMDEEFGIGALVESEKRKHLDQAYTAKSLKGLTIGHKEEAFKEGEQFVLTLQDRDVLDESDDVLENVNIADDEKASKNVENKIKRPDYKPYDEPEFDEFGILKPKSLLSKYDEEIEGAKKESFKIGKTAAEREIELEIVRMKLRQQEGKVSLELPQKKIAAEYYTEEEMAKFKKPKKKIKKVLRKKTPVEEEIEPMEIDVKQDHGSRKSKSEPVSETSVNGDKKEAKKETKKKELKKKAELNIKLEIRQESDEEDLSGFTIEEDELQNELQVALEKARKLKARENAVATTGAASIAKVAEEVRKRTVIKTEPEDDEMAGNFPVLNKTAAGFITLNATAEFCRNLGEIPTYGLAGNREEDEELLDFENELIEERQVRPKPAPIEKEDNRGQWNEVEMEEEGPALDFEGVEALPILEEEPDVSVGVAGALQLAMKKGYLDKDEKKLVSAGRGSLLQAQSYTIEEKFYEDDKIGRRERYNGPVSDFRDKNDYKPMIQLTYTDDHGKLLDQKEAFRHLSHKFHGKGPGRNKIDKRMKKKDQESKLRQMSSTDTPLNTLKLLQEKQKELQSPFIVLTGGQKNLQQSLTKPK